MELLWAVESPTSLIIHIVWKAQSKLYKVKFVGKRLDKQKKEIKIKR